MSGSQRDAGTEVHVLWHCAALASSEHGVLRSTGEGWRLDGTVALPIDGVPAHIEHSVTVGPDWRTQTVTITISEPVGRSIDIAVDDGIWHVDGSPRPDLAGCVDIDLGWSPATNLLPVRRLGLDVDASATIDAAWLRFPELTLERNTQTYTRRGERTWRYRSGPFDFAIAVDHTGLTVQYGTDLWTAVARRPT